jgi:hypothetical protein
MESLSGEPLNARGVDDKEKVMWCAPCGCCFYRSRHAIAARLRELCGDVAGGDSSMAAELLCCPFHDAACPRPASAYARQAFAVLLQAANGLRTVMGPTTVLWEAYAVPKARAFDFWLHPHRVLVEVDGEQHDAAERQAYDRFKEGLAVAAGYHVVRFSHEAVSSQWSRAVLDAMLEAWHSMPAHVHYTPLPLPPPTL